MLCFFSFHCPPLIHTCVRHKTLNKARERVVGSVRDDEQQVSVLHVELGRLDRFNWPLERSPV